MANFKKREKFPEPRINGELRDCENVRLLWEEDGETKSEVVTIGRAFEMSRKYELDLIEVNGKTVPPVVRLANYSKYLYELKKQMKQKRKPTSTLKEVQLKSNISLHDMEIKARKAAEFIEDGDKVKVVLLMRGRELTRREESKKCIYRFIEMMSECSVPETMPRDEGNRSIVILKKKN